MIWGDQWLCPCGTGNLFLRKLCRTCAELRLPDEVFTDPYGKESAMKAWMKQAIEMAESKATAGQIAKALGKTTAEVRRVLKNIASVKHG